MSNQVTYKTPVAGNFSETVSSLLELSGFRTNKLSQLSESSQRSISSGIAQKIFDMVEDKFESDPLLKEIMKTEGDVTKMSKFSDLEDSINYLSVLAARSESRPKAINALENVLTHLLENKRSFAEAFKRNYAPLKFYYTSMVINLFNSTALVITSAVGYYPSTDSMDNTGSVSLWGDGMVDDITLSALYTLDTNIKNRKSQEFIKHSLGDIKNLKESIAVTVGVGLAVSIWVLWYIRDIIFYFLRTRRIVAEWFESYATFLEIRATTANPNSTSASKQKKLADKFRGISKKINIEAETTSKRTAKDLRKLDNKELGNSVDAYNDILI